MKNKRRPSELLSTRVDLTAIEPWTTGGVEAVAAGVTRAMLTLRPETEIVVNRVDRDSWGARLGVEPESLMVVNAGSGKALRSISRRAANSRLIAPARDRASRFAARTRAQIASMSSGPVWYPFHRSPIAAELAVVTVHDLRVFQEGLANVIDQKTVSRNISRATAIVTSWIHPYNQVLEQFPDVEGRLFRVPLPVLNPGTVHSRPVVSEFDKFRILVPAATSPHKNQELVIRALVDLPEVKISFTGKAEEPRLSQLRSLAGSLGVLDQIEWVGFVESHELDELYNSAHAVVMPSRWEAASGPVFEAVVRGIPFIATDIAPIAAQCRQFDLVGPLVDPDSPIALSNAIRGVRENYRYYVKAQEQPSRVLSSITWEATAAAYLDILDWSAGRTEIPLNG